VTRRYAFSASHRLHSERLSAEENERLFGKCNHPFGHGHNYYLEVTVAGQVDPHTGMVVPPAALDAHVERAVLARLDHRDLNADVPEFAAGLATLVPTTENLVLRIGRWLEEGWPQVTRSARLARLRLEETGSNTIEMQFSRRNSYEA
jgi:6-pyruvoyltetrahydropterin/6-carboxytetrahydropterin synthase